MVALWATSSKDIDAFKHNVGQWFDASMDRLKAILAPFPEFADPTCSGAKTDHMTAPQDVTVVTAVLFSATDTLAELPAPLDVMTGASFWFVTVTAIVCVSVPPAPSEAATITS